MYVLFTVGHWPNYVNQRPQWWAYANIFNINNVFCSHSLTHSWHSHSERFVLIRVRLYVFFIGTPQDPRIHADAACWSSYRLYSNRRNQCKELLTLRYNVKAATTAIYTFRHNTHKLAAPNMMWWAENAIIMKFTRGNTHNVTIHMKPCCGGNEERKNTDQQTYERTYVTNTQPEQIHCAHIIRFSFVVRFLSRSHSLSFGIQGVICVLAMPVYMALC